jgi:hypothetical protein
MKISERTIKRLGEINTRSMVNVMRLAIRPATSDESDSISFMRPLAATVESL